MNRSQSDHERNARAYQALVELHEYIEGYENNLGELITPSGADTCEVLYDILNQLGLVVS